MLFLSDLEDPIFGHHIDSAGRKKEKKLGAVLWSIFTYTCICAHLASLGCHCMELDSSVMSQFRTSKLWLVVAMF